jgi:hypothetical protein
VWSADSGRVLHPADLLSIYQIVQFMQDFDVTDRVLSPILIR